jgi:hypothetical protein
VGAGTRRPNGRVWRGVYGCGLVTPRPLMGRLTWCYAYAGLGWPVGLVYLLFVMCVSLGGECYTLDSLVRLPVDRCLPAQPAARPGRRTTHKKGTA